MKIAVGLDSVASQVLDFLSVKFYTHQDTAAPLNSMLASWPAKFCHDCVISLATIVW